MNYYPFHLGDYAAHTSHLEPMEDLAYRRMLDAYYLRESTLPTDLSEVARLIRMRQNIAEVEAVLREFFTLTSEGWSHVRCDEEIERMQDKQAKARASAAASVNARRAKVQPQLNAGTANVERTLNDRSTDVELPTPTPTPNKVERASPTGSRLPTDWQLPDDWAAWARQERSELDPNETAQRFADYWHGVAGAKGRKADWLATWRNWVRNEKAKPVSFAQQAADVARVTVPGPVGPDPALIRIEEDRKRAVPMPDSVRAVINTLTRKVG